MLLAIHTKKGKKKLRSIMYIFLRSDGLIIKMYTANMERFKVEDDCTFNKYFLPTVPPKKVCLRNFSAERTIYRKLNSVINL